MSRLGAALTKYTGKHWNVNTATFVASATGRVREATTNSMLGILEEERQRNRRVVSPPVGQMGLRTISALVVVEDGRASTSPSCLDLAWQAPSANVAVFTFQCTKPLPSLESPKRKPTSQVRFPLN